MHRSPRSSRSCRARVRAARDRGSRSAIVLRSAAQTIFEPALRREIEEVVGLVEEHRADVGVEQHFERESLPFTARQFGDESVLGDVEAAGRAPARYTPTTVALRGSRRPRSSARPLPRARSRSCPCLRARGAPRPARALRPPPETRAPTSRSSARRTVVPSPTRPRSWVRTPIVPSNWTVPRVGASSPRQQAQDRRLADAVRVRRARHSRRSRP